jgi:hypothetical protein
VSALGEADAILTPAWAQNVTAADKPSTAMTGRIRTFIPHIFE